MELCWLCGTPWCFAVLCFPVICCIIDRYLWRFVSLQLNRAFRLLFALSESACVSSMHYMMAYLYLFSIATDTLPISLSLSLSLTLFLTPQLFRTHLWCCIPVGWRRHECHLSSKAQTPNYRDTGTDLWRKYQLLRENEFCIMTFKMVEWTILII